MSFRSMQFQLAQPDKDALLRKVNLHQIYHDHSKAKYKNLRFLDKTKKISFGLIFEFFVR